MKKLSILFFVGLSFFSCNDDSFNGRFIFPIQNLSFEVDPTMGPPNTYYIPINNVRTNVLALLAANQIDPAEVEAILPFTANLTVVFQNARIDFIRNLSIRLCPLGENRENCGQEAFWRMDVPFNTGFNLGLNASNVDDLSDILMAENINVQVKLEELVSQPAATFTIVLDMEFEVR